MQISYDKSGLYVEREKKPRPINIKQQEKSRDWVNILLIILLVIVVMIFILIK